MPQNTNKPHHSPHKRTKIVYNYLSGVSAKAVAAKYNVTPRAVYNINQRYKVQKSAKSNPRSGRPRVITERGKRHLFRLIEEDPFIQNNELLSRASLTCVTSTLTRFLRKEGIQHFRALRRPKLTPEVAAKRLAFARLHVQKPLLWWKRVIFSDETTIARGDGKRHKWVFAPIVSYLQPVITSQLTTQTANKLDKKYVQSKEKPTRHSQMFWAGFGWGIRTSLVPLLGDPDSPRGGVTGRVIQACLEENLPTIASPGSKFIQDNAPTHTARVVQNWLRNWARDNGVELIDWPPYSPDLNAIENLWPLLKEHIIESYPELSDMPKTDESIQRLCEAAVEKWEDLEDRIMFQLIRSMVRRLEAVIQAGGWYTKY